MKSFLLVLFHKDMLMSRIIQIREIGKQCLERGSLASKNSVEEENSVGETRGCESIDEESKRHVCIVSCIELMPDGKI